MRIDQAILYVFLQRRWLLSLLLVALLPLVPIVGALLVGGFLLGIARNVIHARQPIMPSWGKPGRLLIDGAKVAVVLTPWVIANLAVSALVTEVLPILLGPLALVVQVALIPLMLESLASLAEHGRIRDAIALPTILRRISRSPGPALIVALTTMAVFGGLTLLLFEPFLWLLVQMPEERPFETYFLAIPLAIATLANLTGIVAAHLAGQAHRVMRERSPDLAPSPAIRRAPEPLVDDTPLAPDDDWPF